MKPLKKRTYIGLHFLSLPLIIPIAIIIIPFFIPIYLWVKRDSIYAKYLMDGLKKNYSKYKEDVNKLMENMYLRENLRKKWEGNKDAN